MHSILNVVVVAIVAYLGTMLDNFIAFAAQLLVTEPVHHRKVSWAQLTSFVTLLLLAGGVGSILAPIPTRWIGLLCLGPWALGVHAWRQRNAPVKKQFRRGATSTFVLTLALGGDNIAVWVPLLRAAGVWHGVLTVMVFLVLEIPFIKGAQSIAQRPRTLEWGRHYGPQIIPYVYCGLGLLILIECRTLAF